MAFESLSEHSLFCHMAIWRGPWLTATPFPASRAPVEGEGNTLGVKIAPAQLS